MVHLKDVLRVEPDHEIANGMLGGIYAELKMPERATACYEQVLASNPRNVLARFQLGLLQLSGGRRQEAAETLRQAAQLMPTDHESYPQLRALLESLRS